MSKKIIFIRVLLFVLILLTIWFIWSNSLESASESSAASNSVIEKVKPVIDPHDKIDDDVFVKIVRKAAHFSEFALLGCEVYLIVISFEKPDKRLHKILSTIAVSFPVAVIDELLQLTSEGRSCEFSDMMIDLSGIIAGVLLLSLLCKIILKISKKQ